MYISLHIPILLACAQAHKGFCSFSLSEIFIPAIQIKVTLKSFNGFQPDDKLLKNIEI
jgi:hypothetical protein